MDKDDMSSSFLFSEREKLTVKDSIGFDIEALNSEELHVNAEKIFKSFEITQDYNEHTVPPDLKKSRIHQKANSFAIRKNHCTADNTDVLIELDRCNCCMKHLNREEQNPLKCSFDVDHRISALGSGYPLYLYILIFAMKVFAILCVTSCFYMFHFYQGKYCMDQNTLSKRYRILKTEMNKQWGIKNNLFNGMKKDLYKLKYNELPPQTSHIKGQKTFYLPNLHRNMNLYCNWAAFLRKAKNCIKYKQYKCNNNFTAYCKILAYNHFIQSYYKKQCVANWGINNTLFEMGNRPYLSLINSPWYDYVNIFTVFAIWLTTQAFNIFYKTIAQDYDEHDTTCADFSVMLGGMPERENLPHLNIKEAVQELIASKGYTIRQHVMIYDTSPWTAISDKLTEVKDKLGVYIYRIKLDPKLKNDHELKEILRKYYLNNTRQIELMQTNYTGTCSNEFEGLMCISFNTEPEKEDFLTNHKKSKYCCCFTKQKKKLRLEFANHEKVYDQTVKKAQEPSDIIWTSYDYTSSERLCRKIFAYLIVFIVQIIGTIPITISSLWTDNLMDSKYSKATLTTDFGTFVMFKLVYMLNSLIVVTVNNLLEMALEWAADYSKPLTITDKETMIASSLYRLQFMNSGIIQVGCSMITQNFFGINGVSDTINFMFIINLVLPIVLVIFNPKHLIAIIKKWLLRKAIENKDPKLEINQRQANQLYEKQDFVMSAQLSFVLKTLSITMFFLPISPLISFIGQISIMLQFFLFKFVLFKYSNNVHRYSSEITCRISQEFDLCLMMFPCGLILVETYLSGTSLIQFNIKEVTFCQLIFCFVMTFIQPGYEISSFIYKKFFKKEKKLTDMTFDDKVLIDSDDYLCANPIFKSRSLKDEAEKNLLIRTRVAFYKNTINTKVV